MHRVIARDLVSGKDEPSQNAPGTTIAIGDARNSGRCNSLREFGQGAALANFAIDSVAGTVVS